MRRRRDVEPNNPFQKSASSPSKIKRKAPPKPTPRSIPEKTNRIDAVAVRKQMAMQREEEAKKEVITEPEVIEIEEDIPPEPKVVQEVEELVSEKTVAAGAMLFGVEEISDQNAEQLSEKAKENLMEKKNKEKPGPPRRKGRNQKTGGGRQPKVSKFNRRKYLEYKVDVKKMLDEFEIEEEHRSNILGQIWAKGERVGVTDAKDFITEKVEAGVIPEAMADRLKVLIKRYSTKR